MQTPTQYPLILKLLIGLGRVWLAALIVLIFTPLINAFGLAFGIPVLSSLTGVTVVAAILVLFLSVPLSWGLGCAGLLLEWLGRHRSKQKRKLKRQPRSADRRLRLVAAQDAKQQRLAEPRRIRLEATACEPGQRFNSERLAGGQRRSKG